MWCFARFATICAILKNAKNTHGGVLLLVKLHVEANNVTKSKTPLWVLFTIFKLCKWHWIVENVIYFINVFWRINFGPKFFYGGEGEINTKAEVTEAKYIIPSTEHHWSIYCCIAVTLFQAAKTFMVEKQ